jgi:hypothetical protein
MKTHSLSLAVRVTYAKEDGTDLTEDELRQLRRNLESLARHAAGEGALTAHCSDVQVEAWDQSVATADDAAGEEKPQWPRPTS